MFTPRKEIIAYDAPWDIYSIAWSKKTAVPFRLAIGSFIEEYRNKVQVLSLDAATESFQRTHEFEHPYPPTKLMWEPSKSASSSSKDLLATTGDYLRIWDVDYETNEPIKPTVLISNKKSDICPPLTSMDWNEEDTNIIGTSSIDTTCTIWDVETQRVVTMLIAHDREVYDIAFAQKNHFASVGADGSVRMFDLRKLQNSTILYESPHLTPLLRLCWNKADNNYLATLAMDSQKIIILDIRRPSLPVTELMGHSRAINTLQWSPTEFPLIATAGDDSCAIIWDILNKGTWDGHTPQQVTEPILIYKAKEAINNLSWSEIHTDEWIGITAGKQLQILRV